MRCVLVFLSFISLSAFPQHKLSKTKITDNIRMSIPKGFREMDELDFSERYPSVRKPIAAFTNYERSVDISVNVSATQWPDANAEMAQKFFKSSIYNLFDDVNMINEGIREIRGKKFIYFEFESRIKGQARTLEDQSPVLNYTYLQYLLEPKRTLVFSFNCPRRIRLDWQGTAGDIMTSIKVK